MFGTSTMRIPSPVSKKQSLGTRNLVLGALIVGCTIVIILVVSCRSNDVLQLMTETQPTRKLDWNPTAVSPGPGSSSPDFQVAYDESLGFFTDIPEREWNLLKQRVREIQPNKCPYCRGKNNANAWFQNHYEPEFGCRHEKRVGRLGDGGKWICDPHRYKQKMDCLVYSVGSHNDFSFERWVYKEMGQHCEVHTFDPGDYWEKAKEEGVIYHQWGIHKEAHMDTLNRTMKTLRQTAEELGHIGRTIDVFKIDCDGCELDSWPTWVDSSTVGLNLQQVLIEIHARGGSNDRFNQEIKQPATDNFFKGMHKLGYVIFHKEPNIHYWSFGNCVEFAFLKLAPSFFAGME